MDADIGRLLDEATAIKERLGLNAPVDVVATYMALIPIIVSKISELPASQGYEPMLVEAGWNPIVARATAALLVRHGRRCAEESSQQRPIWTTHAGQPIFCLQLSPTNDSRKPE
jgi:hypothetical protein